MKRIVMILMAVALIALPTMAQQQEWKSTSTMQGVGSTLSPNVQQVGAVHVSSMATTTSQSYSPAKAPGMRREGESYPGWHYDEETGQWVPDNAEEYASGAETGQANQFPIGDAVLPMMLMAMLFAGVVYTRRKKALNC